MQDIINRARSPAHHWTIPDQPWQRWVRVRCRINWQYDGVEWVDALAKRWTSQVVWVEFPDHRLHGGGVWLEPRDVRRR